MSFGYIFRAVSINNPDSLMLYIAQSLFIILPPSLYAATVYMIFGRIVRLVDTPHFSLIRPERVTKIFVTGDIIAFFVQAGAGGMLAMQDLATTGNKLMLVGLFAQLAFFGFFVVVSSVFHYRVAHSRLTMANTRVQQSYGRYHWTTLLKTLYVAVGLIIFRCIFRVVEFAQGRDGPIQANEVYIYAFDTVPMLIVQWLFNVIHSGMVLPSDAVLKKGEPASYAMMG
jgi:hypothetical protein